jgi:hypothetical protein
MSVARCFEMREGLRGRLKLFMSLCSRKYYSAFRSKIRDASTIPEKFEPNFGVSYPHPHRFASIQSQRRHSSLAPTPLHLDNELLTNSLSLPDGSRSQWR